MRIIEAKIHKFNINQHDMISTIKIVEKCNIHSIAFEWTYSVEVNNARGVFCAYNYIGNIQFNNVLFAFDLSKANNINEILEDIC